MRKTIAVFFLLKWKKKKPIPNSIQEYDQMIDNRIKQF